ncbi:BnaAnng15240D [Brassica napus]|uniref:BnaAnng15240D protein n=1 Tax=Brassica napus TaxID=3708 RepID=A0A078J3U3_BRANA|nr:BnaAnng15240D [Brassica napus]
MVVLKVKGNNNRT